MQYPEKRLKKVSLLNLLFDERGNCYLDDIIFDGNWHKYVYVTELIPQKSYPCSRCGKHLRVSSNSKKQGCLVDGKLYCYDCLGKVKWKQESL